MATILSRKLFLILVAVLAITVILLRTVEGATTKPNSCKTALKKWDDESRESANAGKGPPLDPKKCSNVTLKRGKSCFKSNGSEWQQKDTCPTKTKSWMGFVNWKSVGDEAKSPLSRPKGYLRLSGWDVKSSDRTYDYMTNGDWTFVKDITTTKQCAKKCDKTGNGGKDCGGFSILKTGKANVYACRLYNNKIVNGVNPKKRNTWTNSMQQNKDVNMYLRQGTLNAFGNENPSPVVAPSGGAASVPQSNSSSTIDVSAHYTGADDLNPANKSSGGGGTFYMRLKLKPNTFTYAKVDTNDCDPGNDRILKLDTATEGMKTGDLTYTEHMQFVFQPHGSNKYAIYNKKLYGIQDCNNIYLSADTLNCVTQGGKLKYKTQGEATKWFAQKQSNGSYKFRAESCGDGDAGGWLWIGKESSNLTSNDSATSIYLQRV